MYGPFMILLLCVSTYFYCAQEEIPVQPISIMKSKSRWSSPGDCTPRDVVILQPGLLKNQTIQWLDEKNPDTQLEMQVCSLPQNNCFYDRSKQQEAQLSCWYNVTRYFCCHRQGHASIAVSYE